MKRLLPLAIGTVCALSAHAERPSCTAPDGVEPIRSIRALPLPVRNAMLAEVKDMVDADQPYDDTDVVRHGAHFNRFAFSWNVGDDWIIVSERGGFASSKPIYVIHWTRPGDTATLTGRQLGFQQKDLCATALQLLRFPGSATPGR